MNRITIGTGVSRRPITFDLAHDCTQNPNGNRLLGSIRSFPRSLGGPWTPVVVAGQL